MYNTPCGYTIMLYTCYQNRQATDSVFNIRALLHFIIITIIIFFHFFLYYVYNPHGVCLLIEPMDGITTMAKKLAGTKRLMLINAIPFASRCFAGSVII